MLDSFYRQLFRPQEVAPSLDVAALIAGVILLVMTFNAGANLQLSASALSFLLVLFTLGGFLGIFWFTAALLTLMSLGGRPCEFQVLLRAVLIGLWPLMFSGVALAAQRGIPLLGALFSLVVLLGTFVTLARSLAQVQSVSLGQAFLMILVTLTLSVFAIGGVVVWPLMLLLGL